MAGELIANDLILPTIDTSFVNTVAMTSARDSVMYGDTMYGYPVSCETYALFYNKKFVDLNDIPSTWEGMIGARASIRSIPANTALFSTQIRYIILLC